MPVLIANPIYDSVFKHLMEDREVAAGMIARLLGMEIEDLEPHPQEVTSYADTLRDTDVPIRIFRLDFSATVTIAGGQKQRVLIELQKAGKSEAIVRFRTYLGRHYASPASKAAPLPVIAIYLLGFPLDTTQPKVVKVRRAYLDGLTGTELTQGRKDPFIECLTHDAVVVQLNQKWDGTGDERLGRLLSLFEQDRAGDDPHYLRMDDAASAADPLVGKVVRILQKAAADTETRTDMETEDELQGYYERLDLANAQVVEERRQKEEERRQKEEERRQKDAALARIEELEAALRKSGGV